MRKDEDDGQTRYVRLGVSVAALAQFTRIAELETQVKILTGKATAAVDKLADYEDELRQLKSSNKPTSDPNINAQPASRPTSATGIQRIHLQSRISHLLPSNRRATSQPPSSAQADQTSHTNNRENAELLTMLTREQSLRQAAESRVSQTNEELEELSAQLFTEANEMVATERKARAKLEERVAVLERRDKEKRTRLEVLESRLGRIERVREMLKSFETTLLAVRMSVDPANGHVVPPNPRDISGEEAWARRCSLPTLAPWDAQSVKTEGNVPQDTLSTTLLPSKPHEAEEGEISETQARDCQPQSSKAKSFLYSIPQWQPPSTQLTSQQPSKIPSQPVPSQRIRPPSARLKGLPPPSLTSTRQDAPSSTQLQGQPPSFPFEDVGYDEKIPRIYRNDVLDKRIGIRPRLKKSTEFQQLKNPGDTRNSDGASLPRSMKIIIQQFIVANGYVFPHKDRGSLEVATLRNSLMLRLDLHKSALQSNREFGGLKASSNRHQRRLDLFAAFTRDWTDRNWDGSMRDLTRAATLTTTSPMLSVSPDDSDRGLRDTDSRNPREATRQVVTLEDDIEGQLDSSRPGLETTLKRPAHDATNNQIIKRARTRSSTPMASKHDHIDHAYGEVNGLEPIRPEERGLPMVIEAIYHARATLLHLAPMTAKDLANMQQDWTSHGFKNTLAEMLTIGLAHTVTMGRYFDNALELLSLLKESDHWKASHMKVQVDCASQEGGAAHEQLRNGRVPHPSSPSNGEVEVEHSHEREDTIPDRSQDGKVYNQPKPSTGDIKVNRSSQPEGAAPNQLYIGMVFDPPVAMIEKAQVDRRYQMTAAKSNPVGNEEVSDPQDVPNGSAENPYTL
ncbi:MAG: hypothetical protein ASARMPRED_008359 [Alectoria sarmentosa]|nr:MAG: hypothetical protein ASARMPRED_008359 [Alectoria sarmentosa]